MEKKNNKVKLMCVCVYIYIYIYMAAKMGKYSYFDKYVAICPFQTILQNIPFSKLNFMNIISISNLISL